MDNTKWYWNRWLWLVVGMLLAFAGGSATGYFAKPAEIREKEVVKTVEVEKVVEKVVTNTVYQKVVDNDLVKKLRREIVELKRPDGTVETKTTETFDESDKTKTGVTSDKIEYRDKIVEKTVEKLVFKEKLVKNQPNWLVSVGAGVSVPVLLHKSEIGVPGLKGAVIQAGVERRVVGPFYIGLFGNTQGVLGLSLTGAF